MKKRNERTPGSSSGRAWKSRTARAPFTALRATRFFGLTVMCLLLVAASASAQIALRSSISGVITDKTGAVIPGATVTLTDVDRNQKRTTTTNAAGLYAFTDLTAGQYQVSAEAPGFSQSVSATNRLDTGQTVRVDFALEVGTVKSTVTVSEAAPQLQTESAEVGGIADRNYVDALPSEGRNYTTFAQLATNISAFPRGNGGTTFSVGAEHVVGGVNYTAGGGGGNGFYINGVNNNDNYVGYISYAPSAEAVSEVKLDVANFSAANGRDTTTLNATSRGGTNQYHGAVYDYLENDGLNAIDPYTKATVPNATRNFLQRHQYGGNFGGPIYIPKLVHGKDRAFFFVNYERFRERDGTRANFYRVPSLPERSGDFSELLQEFPGNPQFTLYNPYSTVVNPDGSTLRTPIPDNNLNNITKPDGSAAIDSTALQYTQSIFPMPNYVDPFGPQHSLNNFQSLNPGGSNSYRIDSRFDFRVSNQDSLYFNFNRSVGIDLNAGGPFAGLPVQGIPNVSDGAILFTANYAHVFRPTLANEFIFSWGRGNFLFPDDTINAVLHNPNTPFNKFFQNLGQGVDFGVHVINFGNGYSSPGYQQDFRDLNPSLQFSDNLNWVKATHSLQMGFAYFLKSENDYDLIRNADFFGQFTRAGSANTLGGQSVGHVGGDSIADLELGLVTDIRQRFMFQGGTPTDPAIDTRSPYYGAFIQDKWQVKPNLTLNLGLRYDLSIPLYDANRFFGGTVDFNYPGLQLVTPGRTPGVPLHYVTAEKTNFAPRISLAYRLKSDLVLRAGYGIFYDAGVAPILQTLAFYATSSPGSFNGDMYSNALAGINNDVPFLTFSQIYPPEKTIQVGNYPIRTGPGSGYFVQGQNGTGGVPLMIVDKKSGTIPYYQTYLTSIEKGLGRSTTLSLSYVGTQGRQRPYFRNENQPPFADIYTDPTITDPARPFTGARFTDIYVLRHGLNSFYNAGTIKVERRLSHGLQFLTHYTYSKTVADEFQDPLINYGPYFQYHSRRGEANFSHPHRWLTAVVWQVPYGVSLPKAAKTALYGWKVSTVTTFESGNAYSVFRTTSSAFDLEPDLPNVVASPNLPAGQRTFTNYFNTAAFVDPGPGVQGDAGVGIVRGPGRNNWDVSLEKVFRITERTNFDLRADFLNAFNHTQWQSINTIDGGPGSGFGSIGFTPLVLGPGAGPNGNPSFEPRIIQLGLKFYF